MSQTPEKLRPKILLPEGWPRPRGYSNGMIAKGRILVTGGVIGWDETETLAKGFAAQTRQALANILAILREGGAGPEHLVRLTWYVTDIETYAASLKEMGAIWRDLIGPHYPCMALVQVVRLVESDALVEIEATAVLPE